MEQTVLITGASSGIGFALAELFAANGFCLVLVSQNASRLDHAKESLKAQYPNTHIIAVQKDLSQPDGAEEIHRFTKENAIKIDVLVNNAGVQAYGRLQDVALETIEEMMHLNMHALAKMTRLFLLDMICQGKGRILNVASIGAFQPCPLNSIYCASKSFVLHFSEGIAEELNHTGVTVTVLCPGATKSNFEIRGNMTGTKLFSGNLFDAQTVAKIGYNALMKGRHIAITGFSGKLMVFFVRFMPRFLVTKIGLQLLKKER